MEIWFAYKSLASSLCINARLLTRFFNTSSQLRLDRALSFRGMWSDVSYPNPIINNHVDGDTQPHDACPAGSLATYLDIAFCSEYSTKLLDQSSSIPI